MLARLSGLREIWRVFHRPLRLLLRNRTALVFGALCIPLHAAAVLAMPRLVGAQLDSLDQPVPGALTLTEACLLLAGLAVAEGVCRYVSRRTLIDASRNVEEDLKNELVDHMGRLPVAWFDRARTGDLVSRLTQDVELVRFVMGPLILHGGSALCMLPVGIALMARMDGWVTAASAASFAVLLGSLRLVVPRMHVWSKASQEAIGSLSQRVQEDFSGIRVLWLFAATDRERSELASRNRRILHTGMRLVRLRALVNAVTHSTAGFVTLGVLVVGGLAVLDDRLTKGELFQFLAYLGLMMFPLEILGWTLATLPRSLAAARRIEEVFAVAPEPQGGMRPVLTPDIEVRDLTFTYPGAAVPALVGVSFRLRAGCKLGLVGTVGSGKSTLMALLLRLHDPPRGTVFVGGTDVMDLELAHLREQFAVAPQEPFLFSDTIAANIAFGSPTAGDSTIGRAASDAALDADLASMPEGMATRVGERGVTLSGGQKQRVALARAWAADRPVVVLDDTLSAVDAHTEQRILRSMAARRSGRTTVVAAHRLSSVADADLVLVLDRGRVVEQGTHAGLVRLGGTYARAWRRQEEAVALEGGCTEVVP
jgi:ATP-binding cassette subfamily B protein